MPEPSHLRVADADRERVVDELREHAMAGRLTSEELEERVGAAYGATTRADLDVLRADLPVSSTTVALELRKRKALLRRRLWRESSGTVTVAAVCVGVWLAAGADGAFWPGWVIGFMLLPTLRDAWRLLGPGSDHDVVEARMQRRHERRLSRGQRHNRYRGLPR